MSEPASIGILGTGSYVPATEVTNDELAARVGVTTDWIERKTHIRTRRYAESHEATSDLAAHAATNALAAAGLSADQVAYIIVSTSTPDSPQPPTAALVQDALGAYQAACFDVNMVCSGFIYALATARGLLALDPEAHAIVIGADIYSRILNFDDRATAVLLGDGAGAVVAGSRPHDGGILTVDLHARGDAHELIYVRAGGSRHPTTHDTVNTGGHYFAMQGRKVADFVLEHVPPALAKALARSNLSIEDVDHFVPHQPNGHLLDTLVTKAGLTSATTHRTLERYGNVGSACIPVTLDEASRASALRRGELVLLAGFGGGMGIGTCVMRWTQ